MGGRLKVHSAHTPATDRSCVILLNPMGIQLVPREFVLAKGPGEESPLVPMGFRFYDEGFWEPGGSELHDSRWRAPFLNHFQSRERQNKSTAFASEALLLLHDLLREIPSQ